MNERVKTELACGEYGAGVSRYPQRKWWPSIQLFNQDVGLPPLPEAPWDPRWMSGDGFQRSLAACTWPAYVAAPLFVPNISGLMHPYSQEISKEKYRWRVILDVAHFSPAEISLRVTSGFLEVRGKHGERPDEHGFIARCFTRKYRLPAEIDATKIVSTLSVDGILTVEAPVPEISVPAAIIIPIKVEMEMTEEKLETDPDSSKGLEPPDLPSVEDGGEESPLEVHGDHSHLDRDTAGIQMHEKWRDDEDHETPAGEPRLPVPADGEGTESLQDSSEQNKKPPIEVQVMAGSGEAAEESSQADDPDKNLKSDQRLELEDPDIKQEHTD